MVTSLRIYFGSLRMNDSYFLFEKTVPINQGFVFIWEDFAVILKLFNFFLQLFHFLQGSKWVCLDTFQGVYFGCNVTYLHVHHLVDETDIGGQLLNLVTDFSFHDLQFRYHLFLLKDALALHTKQALVHWIICSLELLQILDNWLEVNLADH